MLLDFSLRLTDKERVSPRMMFRDLPNTLEGFGIPLMAFHGKWVGFGGSFQGNQGDRICERFGYRCV